MIIVRNILGTAFDFKKGENTKLMKYLKQASIVSRYCRRPQAILNICGAKTLWPFPSYCVS